MNYTPYIEQGPTANQREEVIDMQYTNMYGKKNSTCTSKISNDIRLSRVYYAHLRIWDQDKGLK